MEFQDKVVLITGSGSGIGRATAERFAAEGAKVVVSDVNEAGGNETVANITAKGGKAIFVKANVANFEEVDALVNQTVAYFGRLDIAVNNAGIGGIPAPTAEQSHESWHQIMAVNTTGVFYCMQAEIRQMLKQGGGAIVNTASVAGLRGLPNNLAYVASKHAVVGMTKTAAMEYSRQNIRINALCPVFTVTGLFNPDVMEQISKGLTKKLESAIPMKRFAKTSEMADATLWLCSDKASFVTGHALPIDGGLTA